MKKMIILTATILIAMSSCDNISALKNKEAQQEPTAGQEQPATVAPEQPATDAQEQPAADAKEQPAADAKEQPAAEKQSTAEASPSQLKVLPEDLRYGMVSDPDGYTNIRKEPTTKAPIVRRYQSGEYLYYFPLSNGWSQVYSGAKTNTFMGYMSTNRIVKVNPNSSTDPTPAYRSGYITDPADTYVNIRKGPGTNYAITGRLDVGTYVYYQPAATGWVKVYDNNKVFLGYVAKNRIK